MRRAAPAEPTPRGLAVSGNRPTAQSARANAARDAAQDAFVALDSAQKLAAARVSAFAALDAGRDGAAMRTAWAPLAAAGDEASGRFLATLDRYPVDDRSTTSELSTAEGAFVAARTALAGVSARIGQFVETNQPLLTRVERAYATLGPATTAAAAAAGAARSAAAKVRADGMDSVELTRALAALDDVARQLAQGAAVHGLAVTLTLAERVQAAAGTVEALTRTLVRDREAAAAALGSLPTRREVVANRIAGLGPVMSRLRRDYAARTFDDVAGNPARARDLAGQAAASAAKVPELLAAGRTTEAAAAATTARRLFGEAEHACTEVSDRLELLDRASADPHETARQAWFVIRDAQRLVMTRGPGAPKAWAARLDGAAHQLEGAEQALSDGVHPDYLRFIVALDSARDTAASVVADVRAHRT